MWLDWVSFASLRTRKGDPEGDPVVDPEGIQKGNPCKRLVCAPRVSG